jgi:hypothetical protein
MMTSVREFVEEIHMATLKIPLRVVLYGEGDAWIAHSLECDVAGDGPTREEAVDQLGGALAAQIRFSADEGNPRNLFSPADGGLYLMFAAGADCPETFGLGSREGEPLLEIERIELREFIETSEPALV